MKRYYSCDLCGSSLADHSAGIGIYHWVDGKISAEYLHKDGCGHHLCNACVRGLRAMIAELDRTQALYNELDKAEALP
jgi:hypothetical protein